MNLNLNPSVPAYQLGDGGCGKELGIGRVAPVQQALALPQALWAVLEEEIESFIKRDCKVRAGV